MTKCDDTSILSPAQWKSLRGIVDGLMPSLPDGNDDNEHKDSEAYKRYWNVRLSQDKCFMDALALSITERLGPKELADMKVLLSTLSSKIGSMVLFGVVRTDKPFSEWTASDQGDALSRLRTSRLVIKRKAFYGLKRLICGLALSFVDDTKKNPYWGAMAYPGPTSDAHENAEKAFDVEKFGSIINDKVLEAKEDFGFDCIVVGSGAGGSVTAANLSKAGYSVLVIEKGDIPSVTHYEAESFDSMYEKSALLTTSDGNISILAGSTLGGGPTINWSCCIETPSYVRREWVNMHGLTDFRKGADFDKSLKSVLERINARSDHVVHNGSNQMFVKGLKARNKSFEVTKQNLIDTASKSTGYICFGDRSGNKRDMLKTFLSDAVQKDAKIITGAKVIRICHEIDCHGKRKANGVEVLLAGKKLLFRSKRCVVVSAGSLNTPCLLKRSGFTNPHIGKHLHLHPVVGLGASFDHNINAYFGAPMTVAYKGISMGVNGDGYGPFLECPSLHSGLAGANGFEWKSAFEFRKEALALNNVASLIVLQRDKGEGTITADVDGNPVVHYTVEKNDAVNMIEGIKEGLRTMKAAGAKEVFLAGIKERRFSFDSPVEDKEFENFLKNIEQFGINQHDIPLASAHQMGTARLSVSPKNGALSEDGELWDCANAFVFDASTFPTASGANPMCTTLAISHMLSERLAKKLLYEDNQILDTEEAEIIEKNIRLRDAKRNIL